MEGCYMSFWKEIFKSAFDKWLENVSYEELAEGYEERRLRWQKDGFGGNGQPTYEMRKINAAMRKITEERWINDPRRNKDPNFRWSDANRWEKD